jgi:hypothetical protein
MIIHKKIARGDGWEFLTAAAGYWPSLVPVHGVSPL